MPSWAAMKIRAPMRCIFLLGISKPLGSRQDQALPGMIQNSQSAAIQRDVVDSGEVVRHFGIEHQKPGLNAGFCRKPAEGRRTEKRAHGHCLLMGDVEWL